MASFAAPAPLQCRANKTRRPSGKRAPQALRGREPEPLAEPLQRGGLHRSISATSASRSKIPFDALVEFRRTPASADITLVEGIGGVMVPVDAHHTVLD